jgi:hypothetical protein
MGQQISVEDAFPTFQKRCRELFEETLLLRAQVDVRRVAELETGKAQQPTSSPGPGPEASHPDERDD